ncbi:hypothetical protein FACS1894132_05850 [Clostridia bacterium]|nr:hypothetical protein FACS1894132_05850 [Clostridia bacterium]
MNKTEAQNYLKNLVGTPARDADGVFGVQCVDLAIRYLKDFFNVVMWTTGDGMFVAENTAKQFPELFEYIAYPVMPQVGDVISYHSASSPKCGHVAIVSTDTANGVYGIIEQWNGCGTVRKNSKKVMPPQKGVAYAIIGVAHPKKLSDSSASQPPTDNQTENSDAQKAKNPYVEPFAVIKKGSKGDGVKWVQFYLSAKDYDLGSWGVDGCFGSQTEKAVKAFQEVSCIDIDGIVGKITRGKLKE